MPRRLAFLIVLAGIVGALIIAAALPFERWITPPAQEPDRLVIRVSHSHSAEHSYRKGLEKASSIMESKTDGRIRLECFSDEQLGSERQVSDMLAAGTLDMGVVGVLDHFDSSFSLLEFPYLFESPGQLLCAADKGLFSDLQKSLLSHGVRMVGIMQVGFRCITANRPIRRAADLKGLRIRVPEKRGEVETFEALGAMPVPLSFTKVYQAIQTGVVDGEENPLENILDGKLYEVQKYVILSRHVYSVTYVLASETFWKKLLPADTQVIGAAVREGCSFQMNYAATKDLESEDSLRARGMTIIVPDTSSFRTAARKAYDCAFVKRLKPKADVLFSTILRCRK